LLTRNLGVGQSICKIHKLLELHPLTILDSFVNTDQLLLTS
jgi:hypothetical protein